MSKQPYPKPLSQTGFTLVEMLIVVVIIVVLAALTSVNLRQPQVTISLSTTVDGLVSEIKNQQLLAMAGDIGSGSVAQPHGIYIQSNQYTTYAATTFAGGDSNNFVVAAPANVSFATTFAGGKLLFNKGAGDVNSFTNGSNTITITNANGSKTITVNRLGAVTVN